MSDGYCTCYPELKGRTADCGVAAHRNAHAKSPAVMRLGQSPPDALKARARESLSLWDRTTGVAIEVYTGMVAAETAYREAPELVADLLGRIEELEAEREQ